MGKKIEVSPKAKAAIKKMLVSYQKALPVILENKGKNIFRSDRVNMSLTVKGKGGVTIKLEQPPCDLFRDLACLGCAVQAKTGKSYCKGTPYDLVKLWFSRPFQTVSPTLIDAVQKEVAYLQKLAA